VTGVTKFFEWGGGRGGKGNFLGTFIVQAVAWARIFNHIKIKTVIVESNCLILFPWLPLHDFVFISCCCAGLLFFFLEKVQPSPPSPPQKFQFMLTKLGLMLWRYSVIRQDKYTGCKEVERPKGCFWLEK